MLRKNMRSQVTSKSANKKTVMTEPFEEYGSDNNCNVIVAELAKMFAQAQANNMSTINNQAIVDLLQKVNSQLEKIQGGQGNAQARQEQGQSLQENQAGQAQYAGRQIQQGIGQQYGFMQVAGQQQSIQESAEQQELGQQLSKGDQVSNSSQVQQQSTEQLQNLFGQLLVNSERLQNKKSPSSQCSRLSSINQSDKTSMLAVQTASQVLAKAQYELANELDASLQKLKQVISESERIANQISNLLGESSDKKS